MFGLGYGTANSMMFTAVRYRTCIKFLDVSRASSLLESSWAKRSFSQPEPEPAEWWRVCASTPHTLFLHDKSNMAEPERREGTSKTREGR
jgi:hypothetical protein